MRGVGSPGCRHPGDCKRGSKERKRGSEHGDSTVARSVRCAVRSSLVREGPRQPRGLHPATRVPHITVCFRATRHRARTILSPAIAAAHTIGAASRLAEGGAHTAAAALEFASDAGRFGRRLPGSWKGRRVRTPATSARNSAASLWTVRRIETRAQPVAGESILCLNGCYYIVLVPDA